VTQGLSVGTDREYGFEIRIIDIDLEELEPILAL
jgi:hypothetical protein